MSRKKPKNSAARPKTGLFIGFWTAGYVAAWVATIVAYETVISKWVRGIMAEALFIGFVPGFIIALVQMRLVERLLKKPMRGWLPFSLVGLAASALTYYLYMTLNGNGPVTLIVASLLVPVALVQSVWLARRVNNAWLWPLAAMVSALLFVLPMSATLSSATMAYMMVGLASVLQGVVTGSVMRHLWANEREKSKNQHAAEAENTDDDTERLARLRDTMQPDDPAEADASRSPSIAKLMRS